MDALSRRPPRIWRKRVGVDPTWDRLTAPPGFEVRSDHRTWLSSKGCFLLDNLPFHPTQNGPLATIFLPFFFTYRAFDHCVNLRVFISLHSGHYVAVEVKGDANRGVSEADSAEPQCQCFRGGGRLAMRDFLTTRQCSGRSSRSEASLHIHDPRSPAAGFCVCRTPGSGKRSIRCLA